MRSRTKRIVNRKVYRADSLDFIFGTFIGQACHLSATTLSPSEGVMTLRAELLDAAPSTPQAREKKLVRAMPASLGCGEGQASRGVEKLAVARVLEWELCSVEAAEDDL